MNIYYTTKPDERFNVRYDRKTRLFKVAARGRAVFIRRDTVSAAVELAVVLAATVILFRVAAAYAYMARGYEAAGGEYTLLLIPVVYYLVRQTAKDWVSTIKRKDRRIDHEKRKPRKKAHPQFLCCHGGRKKGPAYSGRLQQLERNDIEGVVEDGARGSREKISAKGALSQFEELGRAFATAGVAADEAAAAIQRVATTARAARDEESEIALIRSNESLSRLQKWRLIKRIRRIGADRATNRKEKTP